MRGEEPEYLPRSMPAMELPPHARRRVDVNGTGESAGGITSACAEKSGHCSGCSCDDWNYLRMRGEETALPAETLAVGVVL